MILCPRQKLDVFLEKKSQKRKKFSKKKYFLWIWIYPDPQKKTKKKKIKRKSEIYFLRMVLAFGRKWVWSNPGRLLKIGTV